MANARMLPEGIYTPLPTFFKDDEELGELCLREAYDQPLTSG